MPSGDDITPAELARRVSDVLRQLEELVRRVESLYVRKELLELYKQTIDQGLKIVQQQSESLDRTKADKTELPSTTGLVKEDRMVPLEKRVSDLEDTNKWIFRLVLGFIILAILGAVFATGGLSK